MEPIPYTIWLQPWTITLTILGLAILFTIGAAFLASVFPRIFSLLLALLFVSGLLWGVYNFFTYQGSFDTSHRKETNYRILAKNHREILESQIRKIEETLPLLPSHSAERWKRNLAEMKEALDEAGSE